MYYNILTNIMEAWGSEIMMPILPRGNGQHTDASDDCPAVCFALFTDQKQGKGHPCKMRW
mgnify:FL=1